MITQTGETEERKGKWETALYEQFSENKNFKMFKVECALHGAKHDRHGLPDVVVNIIYSFVTESKHTAFYEEYVKEYVGECFDFKRIWEQHLEKLNSLSKHDLWKIINRKGIKGSIRNQYTYYAIPKKSSRPGLIDVILYHIETMTHDNEEDIDSVYVQQKEKGNRMNLHMLIELLHDYSNIAQDPDDYECPVCYSKVKCRQHRASKPKKTPSAVLDDWLRGFGLSPPLRSVDDEKNIAWNKNVINHAWEVCSET